MVNMEGLIKIYCVSLLLLTTIPISSGNADINSEESREPRVSGRIVKLYSGVKSKPYICPGEGFQPDPNNCAVFYRCVKERNEKFTVFRYQCAPGTVYDPDLETCNHPRSTRRSECGGMLKPTAELSHTSNNNEINVAQSEVPRPISTKIPIYVEQSTLKIPTTATWILSTDRPNTPTKKQWESITYYSPSTLDSSKTTKLAGSTTIYPWLSTNYQVVSTEPPKRIDQLHVQNGDSCTSDGFMGDSENCRKFYRCVGNQRGGFVRYEFSCSELTVWDDDIQGCNHAWAVKRSKCGRSLSYEDESISQKPASYHTERLPTQAPIIDNGGYGYKSNKTVQHQVQISHGSKVTQSQTQISKNEHVIQNQTQIHYGDKKKNNKNLELKQNQTQINYGSAVSQTQIQIDYGNKGVQTQLQIDHSNDSSQSQVQTQESTTAEQNNSLGKNECSESGFMGDANDCKKFYRCVNNGKGTYTKFEYFCGDGTVWDSEIEACNHAWAVENCGGNSLFESTTLKSSTTTKTTSKSTVNYIEPSKTTQTYYITSKVPDIDDEDNIGYGNENSQETTSSSDTPTKTTSTTIRTTSSNTDNPNGATSECTTTGFIGDVRDCKKFYRCVDSGNGKFTKYEFKCGDGTLWDQSIEACNHAWAVKQCGVMDTSKPTSDDQSTMSTTKSTEYHSEPTKTSQSYYTSTQISNADGEDDFGYGNENQQETSSSSTTTTTTTIRSTSSSSSENSNEVGSECTSSGFIGDKNDCKVFYRCVDNGNGGYTKYEFKCGDGTLWDPEIEACNHAWAVKNCGVSKPSHNTEKTTTKVENTTPSTIVQTTVTLVQITNQTPIQNDDYDTGYGSQNSDSSTTVTTKQPLKQDNHDNSECHSSGFMGDENDCKKFYRCVDDGNGSFIRYEFSCGEGTVWDRQIEACNHAWAVEKCGGSNHEIETSSQSTATTKNDTNGVTTTQVNKDTDKPITTTTTSSTTTSSGINNKCSNSGFMGDNMNCKKFYRCVDNGDGSYTRYEFTCGEGTVWDQRIEACNHAWAVENCSSGTTESASYVTLQTTSQKPVMQDEEQDNGYATPSYETTKPPPISTASHSEITATLGESNCSNSGFMGDKNDCARFYRCVDNGNGGYDRYEFTCGEGTYWDESIEACNHAWAVKNCRASGSSTTQPPKESTSQVPSSSNDDHAEQSTEKTTAPPAHHENEVPGDKIPQSQQGKCESEGFYGNPEDCKKFYRCVAKSNGGFTKYEFSCGDGTVWVQEIQACDHDNDVTSCNAHKGSTSKPQHNQEDPSSTPNVSATSSTESMAPNREDDEYNLEPSKETSNDETDDCASEGYFANKQDCRKFYRCVDNGNGGYTKYDFVCGEGTAWDSDLQTCNHINQVDSCSGSSQEGNVNHQSTTNKNQGETENVSSTTQATTSTSTSTSSGPSSNSKDKCESEGYFGDSKDCKKFYRCVDNGKGGYTKYDFTCGDGTIWDQDITTCNHPQDVSNPSCTTEQESGGTSSTTSSTISSSQASSSTTESSSNSQGTTDNSQESSKKPQNNNVKCDKAGFYANPNDCKKFYRCVDWDGDGKRFSVFHFDCGEGTIWDPALDTCNYEDSVYPPRDCSQNQSQNVGGETTTTDGTTSTTVTESSTSDQTTTQESTTSERTTTEQETDEQTTMKQSTTSEKTTTQVPTTSEKTTTQESTTSEQTTTEPPSTNEQTTTQQTTTSEKTTTQDSTTSQQTTTSEKTTTQKSTTSEQITTQQPMTSESTTTQESTTNEQTTTQQSEKTTQESTTSEQTTTQESTTSKQTTTQESTTTEQTTTQQSTTTEETTQESTTSEQTTTQQSTTSEQTTTQQSSTSEQTTTEQSNEQTTEQSTTTTEQTTDETTSTDQSTTQTSSTESDSTENQSTTESSSSDKECPETEDDQYLLVCPTSFKRHSKYCNMFYQCIEDEDTYEAKVAMFKCPNNTIYDENQTQCVTEDKADKQCDGEIANKRRFKRLNYNYKDPIVADKGKQSCTTAGYFSFEKQSECSKGFLKCEKSKNGQLRGHVYQCPDGFIYWSISKRCERQETVRDCKQSFNDWTGRWNIPVERRNIASS